MIADKEHKAPSMTSMRSAEKSKPSISPSREYFHQKIDPHHSVLEAPKTDTPPPKAEASQKKKEGTVKPSVAVVKQDSKSGLLNITKVTAKKNLTSASASVAKPTPEKKKENYVLQIGEKLKNKTIEVGEKVKNKTLEKLSELGVIKLAPKPDKVIFAALSWPLNLSLTDVSEVMKDTNHLSKQENLSVNYPKLLPMKTNVTEGNLTIALRKVVMANRVGFCDCEDYDCMCCARVTHKRIHVNATACSNITFMTKSQVGVNVISILLPFNLPTVNWVKSAGHVFISIYMSSPKQKGGYGFPDVIWANDVAAVILVYHMIFPFIKPFHKFSNMTHVT